MQKLCACNIDILLTEPEHWAILDSTGLNSVNCNECGLSFSSYDKLATHFRTSYTACTFKYMCVHCNMQLPSLCSLSAHFRLHDPNSMLICAQASLVCPECGMSFETFTVVPCMFIPFFMHCQPAKYMYIGTFML